MKDIKYKLGQNIVLRVEDDDYAILFNVDTGGTFVLTPSAVSICRSLENFCNIDEIMVFLREEFDSINETAEMDVKNFIKDLVDKGFAETLS
ncbi:MAG: PqqD family peptide modification chaperone [Candidatus Riflebacteria bacterium]|nr:PqqD family peptide modification chaperone [Candidatus Riflebacteria bacterium]